MGLGSFLVYSERERERERRRGERERGGERVTLRFVSVSD